MLGSDMTASYNTPCRLYNEFMSGVALGNYDYTILANSLIHCDNGQDLFYQGLDKCNDKKIIGNMRSYFVNALKNNYNPTSCQKCKYNSQCDHGRNMLEMFLSMNSCFDEKGGCTNVG